MEQFQYLSTLYLLVYIFLSNSIRQTLNLGIRFAVVSSLTEI